MQAQRHVSLGGAPSPVPRWRAPVARRAVGCRASKARGARPQARRRRWHLLATLGERRSALCWGVRQRTHSCRPVMAPTQPGYDRLGSSCSRRLHRRALLSDRRWSAVWGVLRQVGHALVAHSARVVSASTAEGMQALEHAYQQRLCATAPQERPTCLLQHGRCWCRSCCHTVGLLVPGSVRVAPRRGA